MMISKATGKTTDIRVKEIRVGYTDFFYRTPYEFGGRSVDRITILDVHCTVETVARREWPKALAP
jgi:hypothetical protein